MSVKAAINLAENPRPASLTRITTAGGAGDPLLVTDRSYVGGSSVFVVLPVGGSISWLTGLAGSLPALTNKLNATVRVSGITTLPEIELRLNYTDGSVDTATATDVPVAAGTGFAKVVLPSVTPDGAKTPSRAAVRITNTSVASIDLYLGGLDVRDGPVDTYVDGGQGSRYAWTGEANLSTSTRAAGTPPLPDTTGSGGGFTASVELHLTTRDGTLLADLTPYFLGGTVAYDLEADTSKGTFDVSLSEPGLIDPYGKQYLRPLLTIAHDNGTVESGPLGLFGVQPPSETYDATSRRWQYRGLDLLWDLALDNLDKGYILQKGYSYRDAAIDLIERGGFTRKNYTFPNPPGQERAPADFGSGPGGNRLALLTEILEGAGWAKPWATLDGKITSEPLKSIARRAPTVTYATGEQSPVRWPFTVTPEPEQVGNRVIVKGVRVKRRKHRRNRQNHIREVVSNKDHSHPLSYPRIGKWIDLPLHDTGRVSSAGRAREIGERLIEKAGRLPILVSLTTRVDLRGLHENYFLTINDPVTGEPVPSGQGLYACVGWSMSLAMPFLMSHNLRRVVPIDQVI